MQRIHALQRISDYHQPDDISLLLHVALEIH